MMSETLIHHPMQDRIEKIIHRYTPRNKKKSFSESIYTLLEPELLLLKLVGTIAILSRYFIHRNPHSISNGGVRGSQDTTS